MRISECWGRDGLQAEAYVATEDKLAVLQEAAGYGPGRIEVTSLAHPGHWPQFADALDVVERLIPTPGTEYVVYVPNLRGYQRLTGVPSFRERITGILVAIAATDSYNRKNVNKDTAAAMADIAQLVEAARADGLSVIGCVGTAWCCPIEGPIAPRHVLSVAEQLVAAGADNLMLGDTTGEANPRTARDLVKQVRTAFDVPLSGHFHDLRGTAMANAIAAADAGADWIDCALGGIGGHPPDAHQAAAAGNLCTEDFATVATAAGLLAEPLDLARVLSAGRTAERALGRPLLSRVQRAGLPMTVEPSAVPLGSGAH